MKVGNIIKNPYVPKYFDDGTPNPNYATIYIGNGKSIDINGNEHNFIHAKHYQVIGFIDIKKSLRELKQFYGEIDENKTRKN